MGPPTTEDIETAYRRRIQTLTFAMHQVEIAAIKMIESADRYEHLIKELDKIIKGEENERFSF